MSRQIAHAATTQKMSKHLGATLGALAAGVMVSVEDVVGATEAEVDIVWVADIGVHVDGLIDSIENSCPLCVDPETARRGVVSQT